MDTTVVLTIAGSIISMLLLIVAYFLRMLHSDFKTMQPLLQKLADRLTLLEERSNNKLETLEKELEETRSDLRSDKARITQLEQEFHKFLIDYLAKIKTLK